MKKFSFFSTMSLLGLTVVFLCSPAFSIAAYGDVSTYLSKIYAGDGLDAKEAYLDFAEDVAFDGSGNLYVADTYNNVIRKINTSDVISTFAGTGSYGDKTGAAVAAEFALPEGVAVGPDGTVFVADTSNHKIKKISGGNVNTLVSSGLSYPSGLTVIGGTLYFSDTGNAAIKKVATSGGSVATVTTNVTVPEKITPNADSSALYVADSGRHQVLKVNLSSGAVEVIAGSGNSNYKEGVGAAAEFQNVVGVSFDGGANKLFVTDGNGSTDRVRAIDLSSLQTSVLATDAAMATINFPKGIALRGDSLYVANSGLSTVHRFNKNTGAAELLAGKNRFNNTDGPKSQAVVGRPYAMAISPNGQKIYLAENNQIKEINVATGEVVSLVGSVVDNYREGTNPRVRFSTISGITIDSAGKYLYVADHWNNRIRKVDLATKTSSLVSGTGQYNCVGSCNGYAEGNRDTARFDSPGDIVISPDDQTLYVTDSSNNRVRKIRISDGQTTLIAGSGVAGCVDAKGALAKFNRPYGLAIDPAGNYLYVADTNNHRIRKIEIVSGTVTTLAGSGQNGHRDGQGSNAVLSYPEYITYAPNGKLFFSTIGSHNIKYLDPSSGTVITIAGSGDRGFTNGSRFNARFNNPKGLLGYNDKLYVADSWSDLIRQIDIAGNPPYADPAPEVTGVLPSNKYKVAGKSTDTKMLEITGKNFRHKAKVKFGSFDALEVYVNSSAKLSVKVPFGKLAPGYYNVIVTNIDGQKGTLKDGFIVLNSNGSMPVKTEQAAQSGSQFQAFPESFRAGYVLAAGNIFPGGDNEIIAALGFGYSPQIRIFDEQGRLKSEFFAFSKQLRSGVSVTVCDLNGDGLSEIVTGAGKTGRPHIRIFNGYGKPVINNGFFALDGKFMGGVNLACGDVMGTGTPQILVAASQGGGPHVTIHRAKDGKMMGGFMAYAKNFRGGIKVTTADFNGDGKKEIFTGPEYGAPHVQMFEFGKTGIRKLNAGFYAFDPRFRGGLSLTGGDVNGDKKEELVVSQRTQGQARVKVYRGKDQKLLKNFLAYPGNFVGGCVVGSSDVDGDGRAEIITIPGEKGSPQVRVFDYEDL